MHALETPLLPDTESNFVHQAHIYERVGLPDK
jgi:hypothetical protein